MATTFGTRPEDTSADSRGNVNIGVVIQLYPSKADAEARTNLIASPSTNALGLFPYDDPEGRYTLWARDPAGRVWAIESEGATPGDFQDAVNAAQAAAEQAASKAAAAASDALAGAQAQIDASAASAASSAASAASAAATASAPADAAIDSRLGGDSSGILDPASPDTKRVLTVAGATAAYAPLTQGVVKQATAPADTSRLWLDTASTVFVPSSAFVSLQNAATVPTGYASGIKVPFDFASHDDAGYWDNVNKVFVAQTAGRYRLTAEVGFGTETTGSRWVEIWSSRGSRIYGESGRVPVTGSVNTVVQCSFPSFQFDAGTTFWVMARHTATTSPLSLTLLSKTWFSIERVG